jgi:RNA polymerase sigma factor (sigma-70 family)
MGYRCCPSGLPLAGAAEGSECFPTTHWSTVLVAGHTSPQSEEALARLCQAYWYPLYVFARRQGQAPEDAQDLVQGFFARLLEKDYLKAADYEKGKFRSFLLLAFKRFSANEWDRARRLKRGGDAEIVSLDAETESRYLAEPVDDLSPEKAYERQWVQTLIERTVQRLEAEYAAAGKATFFEELGICISGEKPKDSYAEFGRRLGTTEGTVKVWVHRLRQRYRELLREEIASTVTNPAEVEEEIQHLFRVLG